MPELLEIMRIENGWQLLGLILGLAAIIMAMLQILNELLPTRALFQWFWLRRWIHQRAKQYQRALDAYEADMSGPPNEGKQLSPKLPFPAQNADDRSREAYVLLVASATGGHRLAFLGLPVNQFVGQISAAAQIALHYPNQYFSLLSVLAQPTLPGLDRLWWGPRFDQPAISHLKDLDTLWRFVERTEPTKPAPQTPPPAPTVATPGAAAVRAGPIGPAAAAAPGTPPAAATSVERQAPTQAELDARNRIGHAIQRNLDGILIELSNLSTVWTKGFAIVIGLAVAWTVWALYQQTVSGPVPLGIHLSRDEMAVAAAAARPRPSFWYVVLIGVSAGYAASVLDDIVNAIRRLGQR